MIRYDSPEFWAAVRGEWASIGYSGYVWVSVEKPTLSEARSTWIGSGEWFNISGLDLDPASLPSWRESLRQRPYVWKQPDKDTAIDTPVWAAVECGEWEAAHYAGVSERGCFRVWRGGSTRWTARPCGCWPAWVVVSRIVLADPSDPTRKPPADWRPT
jgi:hypothetical protein